MLFCSQLRAENTELKMEFKVVNVPTRLSAQPNTACSHLDVSPWPFDMLWQVSAALVCAGLNHVIMHKSSPPRGL